MPRARFGRLAIAVVALLAVGCTGSSAASVDPSVTLSAGASAGQAGNLPAGCEPIDMVGPDGESIRLDGIWVAETDAGDLPKYWSIRTLGSCLWGAGVVLGPTGPDLLLGSDQVQTLRGVIGSDFAVDGEIVLVGMSQYEARPIPIYSPLRLLIDFEDDGTTVLREDRVYGDYAPRCFDPGTACLPVLVLRPADEFVE
ncbi:MAG TPA: hypothetical protein VH720_03810 [Candidatus Limnocylindrales bacterium]|jgi:hypothetical protein